MLEVTDVAVWYPTSGVALPSTSCVVEEGGILLVAGRNGSGTTTLLRSLAHDLPPGARRVGQIRLDGADLAGAHPDDLVGEVALVADAVTLPSARVADVVRPSRRARSAVADELVERLGLVEHLTQRLATATASVQLRARLGAALAQRPRLLLVDQPLAPLESRWRGPVAALLRDCADQGTVVVWADHEWDTALTVADQTLELGVPDMGAGSSEPVQAWQWRPSTGPMTPTQQVVAELGLAGPGCTTPAGLRRRLQPLLGHGRPRPRPRPRTTAQHLVQLDDDRSLVVDQGALTQFWCPTAEQARTLGRQLGAAPRASTHTGTTVARACRAHDTRTGLAAGTSEQVVSQHLPALRPDDLVAHHSRGEQAQLWAVLALASGASALVDPHRHLDQSMRQQLRVFCREGMEADGLGHDEGLTTAGPTLWVTTDVDGLVWADRVIVADQGQFVADGRPSAVLDHLPQLPTLAAACRPHPLVHPDDIVEVAGVEAATGEPR